MIPWDGIAGVCGIWILNKQFTTCQMLEQMGLVVRGFLGSQVTSTLSLLFPVSTGPRLGLDTPRMSIYTLLLQVRERESPSTEGTLP